MGTLIRSLGPVQVQRGREKKHISVSVSCFSGDGTTRQEYPVSLAFLPPPPPLLGQPNVAGRGSEPQLKKQTAEEPVDYRREEVKEEYMPAGLTHIPLRERSEGPVSARVHTHAHLRPWVCCACACLST